MASKGNLNDLGYANGWSEDSIERRLVENAKKAGYEFVSEFIPPHTFVFTCEEAGLMYRADCS